jgi:hypothetical protein
MTGCSTLCYTSAPDPHTFHTGPPLHPASSALVTIATASRMRSGFNHTAAELKSQNSVQSPSYRLWLIFVHTVKKHKTTCLGSGKSASADGMKY